ncbi:MAG: hypothetical protein KBC38_01305 [Candidatus Pacebacteria bacterium]|nr:hypothetical protein [Candidatus Paceibacterota bacterium]MBP9840272.1 hypothetical protein [Candidatus Paceibacterota bacterium]
MTIKRILIIAGAAVIIFALAWVFFLAKVVFPPAAYDGRMVSFMYPGDQVVKEYGLRSVLVGNESQETGFMPFVEIVEYRQDPNAPTPTDYDYFLAAQMFALCGTDSPGVTVVCNDTEVEPYETESGAVGERYYLSLIRTNTESGAKEEMRYGPIYAFNHTRAATEHNPLEYKALLVYPSLSSYLAGEDAADVVEYIMDTLVVKEEQSEVVEEL